LTDPLDKTLASGIVWTDLFNNVSEEPAMGTAAAERDKAFVLEAFDTSVNRRDYTAAQRFWSPDYIQPSAHIPPGREGLFNLVKASPPDRRYENALTVADGDYVMCTAGCPAPRCGPTG
jgi:hypothetical protein